MQVASATSQSNSGAATAATALPSAKQATVSITEFMKLLSTEMSNQDPLQPMDPTASMTQLAQFTNLQQTGQIEQYQSVATANALLGAQVTVSTGQTVNGQVQTTTGSVTAIDSSGVAQGSAPQLVVSGTNQEYPLTSVLNVTTKPAAAAPASPSSSASSSSSASVSPAASGSGTTGTGGGN